MAEKTRCPHCGDSDRIYPYLPDTPHVLWHGPCGRARAWRTRPQPLPPQCQPKAVTDPDQRAYLNALDRYLASHGNDGGARIDMLLALTRMHDHQEVPHG